MPPGYLPDVALLIGTAGHVDHGKTSLIRALTGIDADRLPEEKERGMTLDIGFAYLDFPELGRVSIVDVPGHERLVHNMLVGAYGIDVAILCVAADEGVKPQTTEHFAILNLLPVQKLVVAMTRADLADEDTRLLTGMQIAELLKDSRFRAAPVVPVSTVTEEGLQTLKATLAQLLAGQADSGATPWMLPIDRVISVKGHGVVVTGTLTRGQVRVGDSAVVMPGNFPVRVRAIHSHGQASESSDRGKRTALNLSGIDREELRRGMIVGSPGSVFETSTFEARIQWLEPVKKGTRVRVSVGTEEVMGRAFPRDDELEITHVRLESPLACAKDQPVILRRFSPQDLLGGGTILIPQATRKRRGNEIVEGESLEEMILSIIEASPSGIESPEIARRMGRSVQELGTPFETLLKERKLIGFAGTWVSPARAKQLIAEVNAALLALHAETPMVATVPREKVAAKIGLSWGPKVLDRFGTALAVAGKIAAEGTRWRHPDFEIQLSPKQKTLLERVEAELNAAGINPPIPAEVARNLGVPVMAVDEILNLGINAKRVVRLDENVYYTRTQLEQIKASARRLFTEKRFTASEFRDALGTSRKYAIPLLEHLDSVGFTLRQNDTRVLRESGKSGS